MSPNLPHELEELILLHLRRDVMDLKACSLVSYRFGLLAQKILFKNITLNICPKSRTNQNILGAKTSPNVFLSFLEGTPRIANSICSVDVIADSYNLQDFDASLLPCLDLLGNLQGFGLDTHSARPIYWHSNLSSHAQCSLYRLSRSSHITSLRFRRVFELPMTLLAECAALEELSLISVTFQQEDMLHIITGTYKPSVLERRPQLKSLHFSISNEAFQAFVHLLTAGSPALLDLSKLASLSISIFSPRFNYNELNSFLRAVGSSLAVLCFSPMVPDREQHPPLELKSLLYLRTLRLRVLTSSGGPVSTKISSQNANSQVLHVLEQPKSLQRLEEVSIKTDLNLEPTDGVSWSSIDDRLSEMPLMRKASLYLIREKSEVQQSIVTNANAMFPRLHTKEILHVQSVSEYLGFLVDANDTELLSESFRRHNMI